MTRASRESALGRRLLGTSTAFYAANVALGTAVALGAVDTRRIRWVHHALFAMTISTAVTALAFHLRARDTRSVPLLVASLALASVTRTSGRRRSHRLVALTAAPGLVVALLMRKG